MQGCQSSKTRQKFQSVASKFGNGMAKRVESTEDLFHLQYNTIFICHIQHLQMKKKMKKIDDRK